MKDDDAAEAIERAQKQIEAHEKEFEKRFADKRGKITQGDDLAPGVLKMVKVYPGGEAPHPAGRQDGRTPRQQGRGLDHRPGAGHAVHGRRPDRRHRAQSAGRAVAHEHRPDPRSPPGLGGEGPGPEDPAHARRAGQDRRAAQVPRRDLQPRQQAARTARRPQAVHRRGAAAAGAEPDRWRADGDAGVRWRGGSRDQGDADAGRSADQRPDAAVRRSHRRGVRASGDRGLHAHAQAQPPGRRQDARALDRSVLARHPAAAGRQGAVRRPAFRRDGSLGAGSLRRGVHPAGNADGEVRRRTGPQPDVQEHRRRRARDGRGHARVLQRAGQGNPLARRSTWSWKSTEDGTGRRALRGARTDVSRSSIPIPGVFK